jgi:hypothetical protein
MLVSVFDMLVFGWSEGLDDARRSMFYDPRLTGRTPEPGAARRSKALCSLYDESRARAGKSPVFCAALQQGGWGNVKYFRFLWRRQEKAQRVGQ